MGLRTAAAPEPQHMGVDHRRGDVRTAQYGRLVGFFEAEGIAEAVLEAVHRKPVAARAAAHALVGARYGRSNGIMLYERLLGAAPVTTVHASRVRDAVALP